MRSWKAQNRDYYVCLEGLEGPGKPGSYSYYSMEPAPVERQGSGIFITASVGSSAAGRQGWPVPRSKKALVKFARIIIIIAGAGGDVIFLARRRRRTQSAVIIANCSLCPIYFLSSFPQRAKCAGWPRAAARGVSIPSFFLHIQSRWPSSTHCPPDGRALHSTALGDGACLDGQETSVLRTGHSWP